MPKKKPELEILSVEFTLGMPRHPHITRVRMFPKWNRAQVIEESPGSVPHVVGEVSIGELYEIFQRLKKEKANAHR